MVFLHNKRHIRAEVKLQAGHKLQEEHDLFGLKAICEKRAPETATHECRSTAETCCPAG